MTSPAPAAAQDAALEDGNAAANSLEVGGVLGDVLNIVGGDALPSVTADFDDGGPNEEDIVGVLLDEEGLLGSLGGLLGALLGGLEFADNLLSAGLIEVSAEVNEDETYAEASSGVADLQVLGALNNGLHAEAIESHVRLDCANPYANPFEETQFVDLHLFDQGLVAARHRPAGPVARRGRR